MAMKNEDNGGGSNGDKDYGGNSDGGGEIQQSTKSFSGRNGGGGGDGDGNGKGNGDSNETMPTTVHQ